MSDVRTANEPPESAREPEWVGAEAPGLAVAMRELAGLPGLLARHRALIRSGVRRDLAARLSGTVLGWFWPLLSPALYFAVYYLIFSRLFGVRLAGLPESQRAAVGVYMFLGAVLWSGFAESLSRSVGVLVDHGPLIKKLAFPSEILPLNVVISSLVTTCIGLGAFVIACVVTPLWRAPGAELLWVPVLLSLQLVFAYGIALFVGALQVFLRDTKEALGVLLTVWMFVTPIFWIPTRELVPGIEEWLPWVERNPLHLLVYAWRHVLLSGEPELCFPEPVAEAVLAFAPWAVGALAAGYVFFALLKRRFADEV